LAMPLLSPEMTVVYPGDRPDVTQLARLSGSGHQRLAHAYQQLRDANAVVKGLPVVRLPIRPED
jgi:hypothetical protein